MTSRFNPASVVQQCDTSTAGGNAIRRSLGPSLSFGSTDGSFF